MCLKLRLLQACCPLFPPSSRGCSRPEAIDNNWQAAFAPVPHLVFSDIKVTPNSIEMAARLLLES